VFCVFVGAETKGRDLEQIDLYLIARQAQAAGSHF
jgi:hypothetical protein